MRSYPQPLEGIGHADPEERESAHPGAVAQGLSSTGDGAVACILAELGPGEFEARVDVLDAAGRPLATAGRFPIAGRGRDARFAPVPDRGARIFAFHGGGETSTVAAADGSPVPELGSEIVGSVMALAEDGGRAAVLVETPYGAGPPSQAILVADLSAGPASWEPVETGPLGLTTGRVVTHLALAAGRLHAAVADPVAGCDLFRMTLAHPAPVWTADFTRGADRFALNAAVSALAWSDGDLLIGTAALATGAVAVGNWGPELLIVSRDESWDLLIGQPRFSPSGLKIPGSALLPGIDSPRNAAATAIAVGQAGGGSSGGGRRIFLALQEYSGPQPGDRRRLRPLLGGYRGRTRVYFSDDLLDWTALDVRLPYDAGAVRSLCATRAGLLIGHEATAGRAMPVTFVPL